MTKTFSIKEQEEFSDDQILNSLEMREDSLKEQLSRATNDDMKLRLKKEIQGIKIDKLKRRVTLETEKYNNM